MEDLIQRNLQKDVPLHTGFLDPATQREALRLCRKRGCEGELWGGYAGAERKVLFLPATYQEAPDHSVVACIRLQSKGVFAHPDLLGALMAMGTKRDCIGDLCIVQDKNGGSEARAYCLATMAPHLAAITSVGRSAVEVEVMPLLG